MWRWIFFLFSAPFHSIIWFIFWISLMFLIQNQLRLVDTWSQMSKKSIDSMFSVQMVHLVSVFLHFQLVFCFEMHPCSFNFFHLKFRIRCTVMSEDEHTNSMTFLQLLEILIYPKRIKVLFVFSPKSWKIEDFWSSLEHERQYFALFSSNYILFSPM